MNCYACDNPAINACKRCAKAYCEDHGNARYCSACLEPVSALPSFNLYRGALLAMLAGSVLAVLLILRPPGETKGSSPVIVGRTAPTPTPSGGGGEPTVAAETPGPTATSTASSATPSATESPFRVHIVESGDTLFTIAEQYLTPGDDLTKFTAAIAALNNLDLETAILSLGQRIVLPPVPDAGQ